MRWIKGVRHRLHDQRSAARRRLRPIGRSLLSPAGMVCLCLLLSPLISLLEQAVVLGLGLLLQAAAASQVFARLLTGMGVDPVYAAVFSQSMGNVEVRGMAVAGPVGDALHHLAPGLFLSPHHVLSGAWTSALVTDGIPLLASATVTVGTQVTFIVAGLILLGAGLRARRASSSVAARALVVLGLLLQVKGVLGVIGVQYTVDNLETMGLSSLFTKVLSLDVGSYRTLVAEPLHVVGSSLVPTCVLVVIYGPFAAVGLVTSRAWHGAARLSLRSARRLLAFVPGALIRRNTHGHLRPAFLIAAVLTSVLLSQRLFPAQANYDYPAADQLQAQPGGADAPMEQADAPPDLPTQEPTGVGASKVVISASGYNFKYLVNGHRVRLRGVGYNAMYAHLSPKARAARYDQDFTLMRAAGMNTILGWGPQTYDELTLMKAQEHGLGVIMPYPLSRDGQYADPAYQAQVEQDVLRWVRRFRGYPAVRMWGIGNEVIHGMNRGSDSPQARDFARFYVRLADEVHALDPDHPVVYRDAEDIYVAPMRFALQSDKRPRPWFVYGVNYYTSRICDTLRDWAQYDMGVSVMVSEFAPTGISREDRPDGFQRMWRCIAQYPEWTLGGFAYVWTTEGPEVVDRSLGLVDGTDTPTDGSLAALGRVFRRQARSSD